MSLSVFSSHCLGRRNVEYSHDVAVKFVKDLTSFWKELEKAVIAGEMGIGPKVSRHDVFYNILSKDGVGKEDEIEIGIIVMERI